MANQAYAKLKIQLWMQGYKAGLEGGKFQERYDDLWKNGYKKGCEIKKDCEEKGISLKK